MIFREDESLQWLFLRNYSKPSGIFRNFKKVLTAMSLISNCLIDVLGRKTLKSVDEGKPWRLWALNC